MGFLSDTELDGLSIVRMNFQVVGEGAFTPRPAMPSVEQADFFLGRVRDIDISAAFSFEPTSETMEIIRAIAAGDQRFANGAVALARDFDRQHVGQSKAGAFFAFELSANDPAVKLYALLKYDYSEVLTLRQSSARGQLRKIVQAFVKDKRALQKSALIRVVNGNVEAEISATDRGARSPSITDFFTRFLQVKRERDDVELNKAASDALLEILNTVPVAHWPSGRATALSTMREALRTSREISDDVVINAVWVAAGRPNDEELTDALRKRAVAALKKKKISGLSFQTNSTVFKVASKRKIRTVENVRIEFPDSLSGVVVDTAKEADGSAVITIRTQQIASDEVVTETIGNVRQLT
ncbi:nucleoid-associated protein [Lysobacter firmicutimachus]|uniref:Nucleoid-associated protein n=1 Tax=Lysobacter firmicutimachus TaxID=1792846 RepID=A0ABU8CYI4_9GAMM